MPFVSEESHKRLYVEPSGLKNEINDVRLAIEAILALDVNDRLRKRLIKDCVWEVTRIRGDFRGRYRSKGVVESLGKKIQRDHVYQKAQIIDRILLRQEPLIDILNEIVHCVVTDSEHSELTLKSKEDKKLDGWDRYKVAGIQVLDIQTNEIL